MADPTRPALAQHIFWTARVDPAVIVLRAQLTADCVQAITTDRLAPHIVSQPADSVVRLCIGGERFDADLPVPTGQEPFGALVLLDELTPDRLGALSRFWMALAEKSIPPDTRLTGQRRKRAREMLRAIDGRATGATYRAVAEGIFPHHDLDAASWVGSAIRETTIRLVRDGMKLVRGGYRSILQQPRRKR